MALMNFSILTASGVIIIGAVIAYGIYLYLPIRSALQKDETLLPATVAFQQRLTHPSMHILVMGDSTAVGVGAIPNTLSIAGRLGNQFPTAEVVNDSKSGIVTGELMSMIQAHSKEHYDLVVLQIGANDVVHFTDLNAVRADLRSVLAMAHQMSPHIIVLTAGNIG